MKLKYQLDKCSKPISLAFRILEQAGPDYYNNKYVDDLTGVTVIRGNIPDINYNPNGHIDTIWLQGFLKESDNRLVIMEFNDLEARDKAYLVIHAALKNWAQHAFIEHAEPPMEAGSFVLR